MYMQSLQPSCRKSKGGNYHHGCKQPQPLFESGKAARKYRVFLPALELTPPSISSRPHGYAATLFTGNEDELDDSDRLPSRSVFTHCIALYVSSICAVERRQSCAFQRHTRLERRTRPKLIEPALVLFPPSYCTRG